MIKDGSHSLSADGNRVQKKQDWLSYIICNLITINTNYLEDIEKYWTCLYNSSAMQMYGKYMNFLAIKNKREIDTLHYR